MQRDPILLAGGSTISDSSSINNQLAQNWYPASGESGAKSELSMKPTPGLSLLFSAGVGPVRTPHGVEFNGSLYFVSRYELIKIDPFFAGGTVVGTLNSESGFVDMVASPTELLIVDGTDGYIWEDGYAMFTTVWASTTAYSLADKRQAVSPDGSLYFEVTTAGTSDGTEPVWPSAVGGTVVDGTVTWTARNGFLEIADTDFPAASTCTWIDFYFIVGVKNTGQFQRSGLNDGTSWDGLDFATAESISDNIERVYATVDSLYLIGSLSTEVYWNNGNPDFNFVQRSNGVMMVGTNSPWSLAENEHGELIFISRTERGAGKVVKISGASFSLISDPDTIKRIEDAGNIESATGWVYTQGGHDFYVLNLTTNNTTICYDFAEKFWHDRLTYGKTRHTAGGYKYFSRKHVVADYESGNFYEYDMDTYTDNGTEIVRRRRAVFIYKDGLSITISRLELEFEAGVGLVTGQGSDPMVALRYSRDGRTWSNVMKRSIGKIGEYSNRAVWDALGSGNMFLFEVTMADPVKSVLVKATADIEVNNV